MRLIHYGTEVYFPEMVRPIRNKPMFPKPFGGLWTSPENSTYGWKHWCTDESFHTETLQYHFVLELISKKVLVIDTLEDLMKLPLLNPHVPGVHFLRYPNFERLAKKYDAIHLTEEGQHRTRLTEPNLYGWDCESVLIMNPRAVRTVDPAATYRSIKSLYGENTTSKIIR